MDGGIGGTAVVRESLITDRILDAYLELSVLTAELRYQLQPNSRGSKELTFAEFKKYMYYMFDLSHRFLKQDNEVVLKFKKWRELEVSADKKRIKQSITLYEEYVNELTKKQIIKITKV